MELEIRGIAANVFGCSIQDVGVTRGNNMTLITYSYSLISDRPPQYKQTIEQQVRDRLDAELGSAYINLGLVRFL